MAPLRYLHVDVFTSTPLEGNQLAVYPQPGNLTTGEMQKIAQEMNFSETTFIFPPERGGDVKMRIFTPGDELPMAGHPTIGSTFVLAHEGVIGRGRENVVFELGVGPTPVSLEWDDRGLSFAWMTQPLPSFEGTIDNRDAFAHSIGGSAQDLVDGLPVQCVSCGVPFLFVGLRTRAAVDSVAIDRKALARCAAESGLKELPVFFFATERPSAGAGEETVYSRMLAPGFGISEDPATGGASGPLGCYLLKYGVIDPSRAKAMISLQGVAMKRPSRIHISIDSDGTGRITRVRVGGQSVLVGEGTLDYCSTSTRTPPTIPANRL